VKTSQAFISILTLICLASGNVFGDEQRRAAAPRAEKVARASWSPVREPAGGDAAKNNRLGVVQVQGVEEMPAPQAEMVPTPVPMDGPMTSGPQGHGYLEGPIMDSPMYGGTIYDGQMSVGAPCDSLLCSGGNCGGCGGIGCDSGGCCDSPGCASGCVGHDGWLPCLTLCLPQDGWFSAEYLHWYQKGMYLPPLATSNANGIASSPALGVLGTSVLFGDNDDYVDGTMDGLRLSFGFFLDHCHEWSIGADYFGWNQITESATFGPSTTQSIGRPIFNVAESGMPRAELVSFTGPNAEGMNVSINGTLGIDVTSELRSGGFQFRRFLVCRDGCGDTIFMNLPAAYRSRIDLGIGYRYTELDETLGITEQLIPGNGVPAGSFINVFDNFDTQTQFNGFDFGMFYTRHRGLWSLDMQGRFAIGTNNQSVNIRGNTVSQLVGTNANPVTAEGGLLALPSNIGSYSQDRFSVLPEFRANIGYRITPRLKATLGYTFMYWSNVVRPGDQIDLDVNRNSVPRPGVDPIVSNRPEFRFNETDYWAQGISFGGEYRW
jgi:hypothetical protein